MLAERKQGYDNTLLVSGLTTDLCSENGETFTDKVNTFYFCSSWQKKKENIMPSCEHTTADLMMFSC